MDELKQLQGVLEAWATADAAAQAAPEDAKDAAEKDAKTALKLLQAALDGEAAQDEGGADAVRKRLLAVCSRTNGDNPPEDSDELRKLIRDALYPRPRPPRSVAEINDPLPQPLIQLAGQSGALLVRGSVAITAGMGGIGKSALCCSLACDVAAGIDTGPFSAVPGPVLMVAYEDDQATVAWRCREYWRALKATGDPLRHVHVMTPAGSLFGPVATESGAELYNARPGRLDAWRALEQAVEAVRPVLVMIDPALEAFSGNQNEGAPVREFLRALRQLATRYQIGIVLVAHSAKAARGANAKDDPFSAQLVAGSTHWVDGCRAAVALDWSGGGVDPFNGRRLAVLKSNYGVSRVVCEVEPVRAPGGAIVGFRRGGAGWVPYVPETPENVTGGGSKNGKGTKNSHGVAV